MADFTILNQPQNLRMTDVLAKFPTGLAKSCRFVVRIQPGGGPGNKLLSYAGNGILTDMLYLCESAELPGRAFQGLDLRYYGPTFRLPMQSIYEDVNLTFLCRTDFRERQFFDDWMQIINPSNSWNFSYRTEYAAKIQIFQLADAGKRQGQVGPNPGTGGEPTAPEAVYSITLLDTYPVAISPQPMTWADDNFHRLVITFTHDGWYREGRDPMPGTRVNDYAPTQKSNYTGPIIAPAGQK
jgi:hypothetical protein